MNIELKGNVYKIGETEIKSDKFKTRKLVITYSDNPQYPQYRELEAIQDKGDLLDSLTVGQEVTCHINPNGRLWTDAQGVEKCFNADHVWKIETNSVEAPNLDTEDQPKDLPF
jgi:hypothetical protein